MVTWQTNPNAPDQGTIAYWAFIHEGGPDGDEPSYQLGVTFTDGQLTEYTVTDMKHPSSTDLDSQVALPKETLTASFPMSAMPGIDKPFRWATALDVDGNTSRCPPDGPFTASFDYP